MSDNRSTIQLRIQPDDYSKITTAADNRSVPVATLAKGLLLWIIEAGIIDQVPDRAFLLDRGGRPRKLREEESVV